MLRRTLILFFCLSTTACLQPLPDPDSYQAAEHPLNAEFLNLQGKPVSLAEYRGKPVILTFWATWCFSCQSDLRSLNELQKNFEGDLEIVAVAVSDTEAKVKSFVRSNDIGFSIYLDPDERAFSACGGEGMLPFTLVLDREGRILRFPDPESSIPSNSIQGPRRWNSQKVVRSLERISRGSESPR